MAYTVFAFVVISCIMVPACMVCMQARDLLQRVRKRDLYSCSAVIRIPQLEQCHQACEGCKDTVTQQNLKVAKRLYKFDRDKDEFAKNVCDNFKGSEKTSKLKPEDVLVEVGCDSHYLNEHVCRNVHCMQVVEIRLASEKDPETNSYGDPVKQVVFYKKGKGNDEELSEPISFGEVIANKV